ncbi:MAG: LptF/LptG family permease, partial [Duncaniella sp.]|nr:LptF/LptG family permease [Duncaniella sp.]
MTFFICLFIVLMQFLWKYIDDLVGKGLDISVIGELFFYAALTMVPMALPLAILLASLMTFGNLGEKFELTAMKAAGVSLLKSMRPLIILILLIAAGAFFFQNNILPIAQTKMWTLLYSMKQKSPEMEIPEKAFYDQIPGFSIYVEEKDKESGVLRDLMIYDMSQGTDNTRIIVADSGKISLTPDKTKLLLNIYQGEQFENLRSTTAGVHSNNLPYRRETFAQKDIMIAFDANFNRMDESTMRKQYVGKNITELNATIDSVQARVDSVGNIYATELVEKPYFQIQYYRTEHTPEGTQRMPQKEITLVQPLNIDSLFADNSGVAESAVINQAIYKAKAVKMDYEYKSKMMEEDRKSIRRHGIELQKKFTLSFACIIFFFIGAPLGAIIRKGGIGLPLVVSVILFIIYYIIDNTGYKMAKDGRIGVMEGMWLSSAVLLPLGIFFTY